MDVNEREFEAAPIGRTKEVAQSLALVSRRFDPDWCLHDWTRCFYSLRPNQWHPQVKGIL
jgi:hypothetical protein